ncbi:ATP-binding protein [Sphaerisporangium rhizosphaerae]|uniref:ATP-binding protein n=1 Tax=Sphaerisporangium rhizosphaerae TaxID=2269375 RepID=A0ABW2NW04_9ACTN
MRMQDPGEEHYGNHRRHTFGSDGEIKGRLLGVTDLIGSPASVARAREYVREKLGIGHPALDDVTLLVSELVTNAVIHSDSRNGGRVVVALADCYDFIHADIVDDGSESIPQISADMYAEGGRGLFLVEAVSDRWGVYTDHAGRTVWFEIGYQRDDIPSCPRQRMPEDLPERTETATRRTMENASRTVARSVQQKQDLRRFDQ